MDGLLCNLRCDRALRKLSEGDITALTVLYDLMGRQMYALSFSILKNPADAEDAIQDAFVKLMQKAHTYRKDEAAKPWILTITRNAAIDILRSRKETICLEDPEILQQEHISPASEKDVDLERALLTLTDSDRQLVILRAVSGLRYRQISRILSLPVSTVEKRYQRAMKKLRAQLQE